VLNALAAAYWFARQDNLSAAEFIAGLVEEGYRRTPDSIEQHLASLEQQWQVDHLVLGDCESGTTEGATEYTTLDVCRESDVIVMPTGVAPAEYQTLVCLLHAHVRILTNSEEAHSVASNLFHHLRPLDPAAFERTAAVASFVVEPVAEGWSIGLLGEPSHVGDSLGPLLHGQLMLHAYQRTRSFAGFHAGAVSMDDRCVLLPGASGSGKSSLVAGLMQAGFGYCTDELAVIDEDDMQLLPCPINIGLKEGVWSALDYVIPQLKHLPIWERDDGQRVRYLQPNESCVQFADQLKDVAAIVFPHYQASFGEQALLQPIDSGDALRRLTEAGYHLDQTISPEWVAQMVGWLPTVPCYTLDYSDTESAVEAVGAVLL